MQKLILTLIVSFSFLVAKAGERPSPIPSKLTKVQAKAWYEEKARSWQTYLLENEGEKTDWLEYFKASYYAGIAQQELERIAKEISQRFQNSYEAFFVQARTLGWSEEGVMKMKKALQLSEKHEMLPERIILAELSLERNNRKALSQQLFDSKQIYPSLLNYSYNVLMSVEENGILVLQGEATTLPIWILQDVMNVRKDIKILNLNLAENQGYLENWLTENQLTGANLAASLSHQELVLKLPELNPEHDFFYGLTFPQNKLSSLEERLYVVGLASRHSNKPFDHYGELQQNIEQKFLLDYLTVDFSGEPKTASGRVYETNYIVPFLLLKEYYDQKDDKQAASKWKETILTIADRSQLKNRVTLLMEAHATKLRDFKFVELETKIVESKMKEVKGNLYASEVEVTNYDYWFYLDYLRTNNYQQLFDNSKPNLTKYDEFTATLLTNYHYSPANYSAALSVKKKENFLQYPAIDMTYEAAKGYCEWLTAQYNQQPDRKYKKVKFRLPTQKEWTIAALGYPEFTSWELKENTVLAFDDVRNKRKKDMKSYDLKDYDVLYPWWQYDFNYRDKIRNQKECYLANIKVPEEVVCPAGIKGDGFTLMSPVASYFPNNMGLYDVVGNVAEMIDEEGKAMGGSWNHLPEESTITSINTYKSSDASVGVRIFMEVIEE